MTPRVLIRILLAEDHAIVRQGLSALLRAERHFAMVGEAKNGREAVEMARTLNPDIILMDIAMPLMNGLEATRQILAANRAAKVIILSAHSDDEYIQRMSEAGVSGFLEKQTSADILTIAILKVAEGSVYFSPSITKRLRANLQNPRTREGLVKVNGNRLTSREAEVLQLVAEGSANKGVAAELGISIKTVEKHRQQLMNKLNIHDTAGLTRYAISAGVIESSVQLTII
ncbi:MAG: degU 2 [Verrucomicrobia bacterium]|nr:degU 2 [Verrucomicrobiota bacterium]